MLFLEADHSRVALLPLFFIAAVSVKEGQVPEHINVSFLGHYRLESLVTSVNKEEGVHILRSMWTIGSLSIRESAVVGSLILDFAVQWVRACVRPEFFCNLNEA